MEAIAEATMLRLVSGTILGAPVVPPVGSSATTRSRSARAALGIRRASRLGRDLLVVEGDAPVERQRDDALEARRQRLQALDLLEQAAGRAGRRREQDLGFDRVDLRGDRLAG